VLPQPVGLGKSRLQPGDRDQLRRLVDNGGCLGEQCRDLLTAAVIQDRCGLAHPFCGLLDAPGASSGGGKGDGTLLVLGLQPQQQCSTHLLARLLDGKDPVLPGRRDLPCTGKGLLGRLAGLSKTIVAGAPPEGLEQRLDLKGLDASGPQSRELVLRLTDHGAQVLDRALPQLEAGLGVGEGRIGGVETLDGRFGVRGRRCGGRGVDARCGGGGEFVTEAPKALLDQRQLALEGSALAAQLRQKPGHRLEGLGEHRGIDLADQALQIGPLHRA